MQMRKLMTVAILVLVGCGNSQVPSPTLLDDSSAGADSYGRKTKATLGQACGGVNGRTCIASLRCANDVGDVTFPGTCRPVAKLNDACGASLITSPDVAPVCEEGLRCQSQGLDNQGRCVQENTPPPGDAPRCDG